MLRDYLVEPLTVGEPDVAGALAVYPVFGTPCAQRFVSSWQAAEDDSVLIKEVAGGASVWDLTLTNLGTSALLLYEGEELLGGQQNRSLDVSILVGAGMTVTLPVTCVEEGRWDASLYHRRFSSSPQSVPPELRAAKFRQVHRREARGQEGRADQSEVWRSVDSLITRHRSSSPTRAMSDVYEQRRRDLADLVGAVSLREGQLGTVVAIGGRFRVLDFAGRPDVFASFHGPFVQGYALDALAARTEAPNPSVHDAREFAAGLLEASAEERETQGLGRGLRFSHDGVAGAGLVNEGELVQLTAFPDGERPLGVDSKPAARARVDHPQPRPGGR